MNNQLKETEANLQIAATDFYGVVMDPEATDDDLDYALRALRSAALGFARSFHRQLSS